MTTLPDPLLQWLHNQLRVQYRSVDRAYPDIVRTLSRYPSFSPKTDIYASDDGSSALLLLLFGTLPVPFRGSEYRYPLKIWLPHSYPREPPIIYVDPPPEMAVRPGQHVSTEGRIYHPILAQWTRYWQTSNLLDMLHTLTEVFSREPPVTSRRQSQQQQPSHVPPPAEALRNDRGQSRQPSLTVQRGAPPPKPPKTTDGEHPSSFLTASGASFDNVVDDRGDSRPPALPPKPMQVAQYTQSNLVPNSPSRGFGQRQHRFGSPYQNHYGREGPPPPPLPTDFSARQGHSPHVQQDYRTLPGNASPFAHPPQSQSNSPNYAYRQPQAQVQPQQPYAKPRGPTSQGYGPPPASQQQVAQPKRPAQDLMSSPLEVTLPSQSDASMPAPPIPPNPEKDALLHAISQAMITQLSQSTSQNLTAVGSLEAQNAAMQQAYSNMSGELSQLQELDKMLVSNEKILHNTMRDADKQLDNVRRKEKPNVDEVLVAPTIVGEQLYGLVAEERAIGDALFALTRALDKGKIPSDVYIKQTRSLAREQFLKKALIQKIARGMGLDSY